MTMPSERTRSLRWGCEVLREMTEHPSINDRLRAMAGQTIRAYPSPELVLSWIEGDATVIPLEAAQAVEAAGALFKELRRQQGLPPELVRSLVFVLRHFPQPGEALRWNGGRGLLSIRTWLLPEDFYG